MIELPDEMDAAALAWRPRRRTDTVECVLDDDLLVYVAELSLAFTFNVSAHAIWTMCDGSCTVVEIAEEMAQCAECPSEDVLSDVVANVNRLKRAGLLEAW
jgi:hypothetical protein